MNSDFAIIQGKSHTICQDYAASGKNYIIVSDGCSSSPDSDFGARLLVKYMEKNIYNQNNNYNLLLKSITEAKKTAEDLKLAKESIDATLLTIFLKNNNLNILCAGDGLVFLRYKDDSVEYLNIEYCEGYPFYLNYLLDKPRLLGFYKKNKVPEITNIILKENKEFQGSLNKKMYFVNNCIKIKIPGNNVKFAGVITDGIHSFVEKHTTSTTINQKRLTYKIILKELIDFRNIKGKFMQRRINKFLKQKIKENIYHNDDLAAAVLYL